MGEIGIAIDAVQLRCLSMVVTQQSAEAFVATDWGVSVDITVDRLDELVAESLVRSLVMVVVDKSPDGPPQSSFVKKTMRLRHSLLIERTKRSASGVQVWGFCG